MALVNYRTIDIDALDADSPANFDLSTLTPGIQPVSTADVTSTAGQIRQLLRGGDAEGALRGALESVPYGADARGKVRSLPVSVFFFSEGEYDDEGDGGKRRKTQELVKNDNWG